MTNKLQANLDAVDLYEETIPPYFLGVSLIDLDDESCRLPKGQNGSTLYCGRVRQSGSAYCPDCHRICWVPKSKKEG